MNAYKKFIPQKLRFAILRALRFIPDKPTVRMQYFLKTGRRLHLKKPVRLSEKLQWYKLYYRNDLMPICSDKYRVREYLKAKGLEKYLVPLYAAYDSADEIDYAALPQSFILKTTNGSNTNIVCRDKSQLDEQAVRKKVKGFLRQSSASAGREWPYKLIVPKIVIEKLLDDPVTDDDSLCDYKFYCFKESGSRFVLGTAAAVNVAYKGQKYVIKALSVLKKRGYTDYVYQLAGNGSQSRLKKYAAKFGVSEQVVFCGAIPHDRMNEWYDSLDIYIQPSLQEGLPRALAEAIRRALPCIGFRTGGIPELLDESSVLNRHMGKAKRIVDKLEEYRSRETLLALAERNAKHSERYCGKVLNEKRDRFYTAFTKSVGTEQNDNGQR